MSILVGGLSKPDLQDTAFVVAQFIAPLTLCENTFLWEGFSIPPNTIRAFGVDLVGTICYRSPQ